MAVEITLGDEPSAAELVGLYDAVGWTAYTRDPDGLVRAVANSTIMVSARDGAGALIGLARGLSDDASILYLQDVLVHPDHQRTGIGRRLVTAVLERYPHVRQKVLLTDDDEAQRRFYEHLGFVRTTEFAAAPLNAYVRFDPPPTPAAAEDVEGQGR